MNMTIPGSMTAAVYQGAGRLVVEEVPVPAIGPGELLLRVESCGICHTDLKKIKYDLLPGPRIYGHETAGEVVAVGDGVSAYQPGDSVIAFHHIPCETCFYCERKLYAQCPVYKKVGITAGFEPAGGGFAQYVRVMDWIVRRGVEKIPPGVSYETACLVEPVNTCVKAVHQLAPRAGDVVFIQGQGPIGLIFTMLAKRAGCHVLATDRMPERRALALKFGADAAIDPQAHDIVSLAAGYTKGRGADAVISAVSGKGLVEEAVRASRPGARLMLFAQTSDQERIELSGKDICMGERILMGSYSASIDLQAESANLVFSGALRAGELVSHQVPLNDINDGIELALHPSGKSLKIIVQPQRWSK